MHCGRFVGTFVGASTVENPWVRRAIPTENAVRTVARTAEDGHTIRADLFGMGATLGEPCTLIVTCEPRTEAIGGLILTFERLPTFMELAEAADELAAGMVLSIQFFGNPGGVPREPIPEGAVRSLTCTEVGRLRGSLIELAAN